MPGLGARQVKLAAEIGEGDVDSACSFPGKCGRVMSSRPGSRRRSGSSGWHNHSGNAHKTGLPADAIAQGFGHPLRVALYARLSTYDQQILPLQTHAMRDYAAKRGWTIAAQIKEVGSGASQREMRETLLASARRCEIDVVLVWRLDRWGRSVADLVSTQQELQHLGVGFVALTEALDLTMPAGRAMAGLLAVFAEFEREILRERARVGLDHARRQGKRLGRPPSVVEKAVEARKL